MEDGGCYCWSEGGSVGSCGCARERERKGDCVRCVKLLNPLTLNKTKVAPAGKQWVGV